MANGQTALSLTDIPFMYSFVNILFIMIVGIENPVDFSRFYVVGLIAGLIGTFFVYWHPIQWIMRKFIMRDKNVIRGYTVHHVNPDATPPEYEINIIEWLHLSLKTNAIKYLMDKFVSQIYFFIILVTLSLALSNIDFVTSLGLSDDVYLHFIKFGLLGMVVGTFIFSGKQYYNFRISLKLHCIYFLLVHHLVGFNDKTNMIKQAIDLNDWVTAKLMIDKALIGAWGSLSGLPKKD